LLVVWFSVVCCFKVLNKHAINSINFGLKVHYEKILKMWLSLIKSREWLNQNFSNTSQNRIGFKFRFCTCLNVLIISFCSNIGFPWNWWYSKVIKKLNKYIRNSFFQIRTFTMLKSPWSKILQIWTNLESFFLLELNF